MTTEVYLYCYDLTNGLARSLSPMLLGKQVEAIWHTSVVVFGSEFLFDGGVGVLQEGIETTKFGKPLKKQLLGNTAKSKEDFLQWVKQQKTAGFGPDDYNLLNHNCNDFTQAASQFLLKTDIPAEIREMIPSLLNTPFGQMLRPTLEQMSGSSAPRK